MNVFTYMVLEQNSSNGVDLHLSSNALKIFKRALNTKTEPPGSQHAAKQVAASPVNWKN